MRYGTVQGIDKQISRLVQGTKAMARPNILYICSDQHGYRFTGYGGHPLVQTPNLDRLAERGVVFRNAYCGSPVCVPDAPA